ncbi:MAG: flavodoxin-dependent (E)-4-hydroxy-3-methylbut-2-enyl-diphosphate synthase [Halanaerobiales bacterium]
MRRKSKKIFYGDVAVGGDSPITVQSMTNTLTADKEATIKQIKRLSEAGCEIIRVAVPDMDSAKVLPEIKKKISLPLIADIHFDYRLAVASIRRGIDGLRINPGNIGGEERVKKVVREAKKYNVPVRIGVNSGSLSRKILQKYGGPTAEAMVASAVEHVKILEKYNFAEIIISLKATDIWTTIKAHELMADRVEYPFHIGITEAGSPRQGIVKSAVGIGSLLSRGYGDTLRVSLTADPVKEVQTGWQILKALDLRKSGPKVISCPTCGRTNIDMEKLTTEVEDRLEDINADITVAVMGCAVNGPGEAREADIGIAGGKGEGLIFKKGKKIKKVSEDKLVDFLIEEIYKMTGSDKDENV